MALLMPRPGINYYPDKKRVAENGFRVGILKIYYMTGEELKQLMQNDSGTWFTLKNLEDKTALPAPEIHKIMQKLRPLRSIMLPAT